MNSSFPGCSDSRRLRELDIPWRAAPRDETKPKSRNRPSLRNRQRGNVSPCSEAGPTLSGIRAKRREQALRKRKLRRSHKGNSHSTHLASPEISPFSKSLGLRTVLNVHEIVRSQVLSLAPAVHAP